MKKLLGLLVLGFMITSCGEESQKENSLAEPQKENSLTKANLKRRVSSVEVSFYPVVVKFGEVVKEVLRYRETTKYDEQGNKTEHNRYHSEVDTDYRLTYKYDEQGNEIEHNRYNSEGSLDYRQTYKYDEQGNEIEDNRYHSNGSLDYRKRYKYEYDNMGNWVKKIRFEDESKGCFISLKPIGVERKKIEYYQ